MISHTHRFLFIDIVKTGGTSIGKVLEQFGGRGKHHSISRPLPNISENDGLESPPARGILVSYLVFSFVRNPFDRLISLYSYCQTAGLQVRFAQLGWDGIVGPALPEIPARARDRKSYWPGEFPLFVRWLADHEAYYTDFGNLKYIAMVDWLRDERGDIRVDRVGHYENLQQDFEEILREIAGRGIARTVAGSAGRPGFPVPPALPFLNESLDSHKQQAARCLAADPALAREIAALFREDFDRFDYRTSFAPPGARRAGTLNGPDVRGGR